MSDTDDTTPGPGPGDTGGTAGRGGRRPRRSPAMLATVVAVPVAVIVCFVVFLVMAGHKQRDADAAAEAGHIRSISAPSSGDTACDKLLGGLPAQLGDFERDGTTDPAGFARWTSTDAGNVELRCGVERPADLSATSKLQIVNGVQWLQGTPAGAPAPDGGSYWIAVDHRPYVALWVPDGAGSAAIQATSDAIKADLEAASLDLGR